MKLFELSYRCEFKTKEKKRYKNLALFERQYLARIANEILLDKCRELFSWNRYNAQCDRYAVWRSIIIHREETPCNPGTGSSFSREWVRFLVVIRGEKPFRNWWKIVESMANGRRRVATEGGRPASRVDAFGGCQQSIRNPPHGSGPFRINPLESYTAFVSFSALVPLPSPSCINVYASRTPYPCIQDTSTNYPSFFHPQRGATVSRHCDAFCTHRIVLTSRDYEREWKIHGKSDILRFIWITGGTDRSKDQTETTWMDTVTQNGYCL